MVDKLSTLLKKHIMPEESVKEAAAQIRTLEPEDRAWFVERFIREGYAPSVEYLLPDGSTVTVTG